MRCKCRLDSSLQGTIGNPMHEPVNETQCPRSSPCPDWEGHVPFPPSCQSTKQKKKFSQHQGHEQNVTLKKITHRQPVIHHTMAMVATIFPGGMQSHHRLVPPPISAQVLRKPCQLAFGQPFQLLHHLLTLVHRVKTLHPKHNLDLNF